MKILLTITIALVYLMSTSLFCSAQNFMTIKQKSGIHKDYLTSTIKKISFRDKIGTDFPASSAYYLVGNFMKINGTSETEWTKESSLQFDFWQDHYNNYQFRAFVFLKKGAEFRIANKEVFDNGNLIADSYGLISNQLSTEGDNYTAEEDGYYDVIITTREQTWIEASINYTYKFKPHYPIVCPLPDYLSTEVEMYNLCYNCFSHNGFDAQDDNCHVKNMDGGTTGFIRQLFNSNTLTTDEAFCGWGDEGTEEYDFNSYDASHPMLRGFYARLTTNIAFCDKYLKEYSGKDSQHTAEVRFLRAMAYYHLMDAFGSVPFASTNYKIEPPQYSRKQLYDFIESELKSAETQMADAKAKKSTDASYGRVDKAAAWLLLSRLYLNAEVYTGIPQWTNAAVYAKKVIDSDYKIHAEGNGDYSAYQMLFMGDNGETDAAYEFIFPLPYHGGDKEHITWGGSMFLVASTHDRDMEEHGTIEAWGGNRTRAQLILKFFPENNVPLYCKPSSMIQLANDDRAIFDSYNRKFHGKDPVTFRDGFATAKFTNIYSSGKTPSDSQFVDMDFPLFRKAEAYLTYAEALIRLNDGVSTEAVASAINVLRARANAETKDSYTLDDICDEWSREFYFEGRRRIDLIRMGKFGGDNDYNWEWKGGAFDGQPFETYKNVFPLPADEINFSKTPYVQNQGY